MSILLRDLEPSSLLIRLGGIVILTYVIIKYLEAKRSPLNAVPTYGHSGILTSYITAFDFIRHGGELIQEGYDRYPGKAFKIATMSKWIVIISGKQLVDELRKAPDDQLSFKEAVAETTQTKYTMGKILDEDPYHIATVRSPLTRNLAVRFSDIWDEVVASFNDYIPLQKDWVALPAYETVMHIVCRISNRYFVGLPLCRDPDYRSLNETFTVDVIMAAMIINIFPKFLRPIVGRSLTKVPAAVKRGIRHLGPMIEERLAQEEKYGPDWPDKPNDLISWLLDTASKDYHRTVNDIVLRILGINFAAIHTSTMSFTQALYDLAIHPEYVKEMREEAEAIIEEHGWTKAALQKMRKIDSFLKESQRLNSVGSVLMLRAAIKDFTLSDGTLIPSGTRIGVASDAMNRDEKYFADGKIFRGFRFAEMRDGDGELDSIKHQMVSLSLDHIVFGHGRHACPGRFFAVNELKAMFAHVLLTYDVQLENGSLERPRNEVFEATILPNTKAKLMIRRRLEA